MSSSGLMPIIEDSCVNSGFSFERLVSLLNSMIERKKGLESICVTDHDGVVLLKASSSSQGQKSVQVNSSIPMAFSSLISSCEKLEEFGKAYFVIIRTSKDSTFQINFHPLILHVVANPQYEGEALEVIPHLEQLLFGMRRIATSIINP